MQSNWFRNFLLIAVSFITLNVANANPPSIDPRPAPLLNQTVHELLTIDASRALFAEKEKSRTAGISGSRTPNQSNVLVSPSTDIKPPVDGKSEKGTPIRLSAIYGVGEMVHAEVIINGSTVVFIRGKDLAIRGNAKGWKLRRISTPCVDLVEPAGGAVRLCSYRSDNISKAS